MHTLYCCELCKLRKWDMSHQNLWHSDGVCVIVKPFNVVMLEQRKSGMRSTGVVSTCSVSAVSGKHVRYRRSKNACLFLRGCLLTGIAPGSNCWLLHASFILLPLNWPSWLQPVQLGRRRANLCCMDFGMEKFDMCRSANICFPSRLNYY